MDTRGVYTKKAEKYARYRWNYAPLAVEEIFKRTGLGADSVAADIGAGTGILTRHLCGRMREVIAIEPNQAMRLEAARLLGQFKNCRLVDASAEATTLDNHSIDLITVAQAIHWFDPAAARSEFARILKPGGWLALLRNFATGDPSLAQAMQVICTPEFGVQPVHSAPANHVLPSFFFGHEPAYRGVFPFCYQQDWNGYLGALCSASYMPDESHPLFSKFVEAAHEIYSRYCNETNGLYTVTGETELILDMPD